MIEPLSVVFKSTTEVVYEEVSVQTDEIKVDDSGRKSYEWKGHGLKLKFPAESTASFDLKIVSFEKF